MEEGDLKTSFDGIEEKERGGDVDENETVQPIQHQCVNKVVLQSLDCMDSL